MMDRRVFVAGAVSVLVAPAWAEAQPMGRVYRIGFLSGSVPNPPVFPSPFLNALRDLGYVEGRNVQVEARYAEGKLERLPDLAGELVRSQVDVIVATVGTAIEAARRATRSIPIVMMWAEDPVGSGFVASLARPGGNVTGTTVWAPETHPKSLELLKQAFPQVRRLAVLWDPRMPARAAYQQTGDAAAATLGIAQEYFWVETADDVDRALSEMDRRRPDAVLIVPLGPVFPRRAQILEFLDRARLPSLSTWSGWVRSGGLMAYSWNDRDLQRLAATYVDRILKGARPAELPVEQPRTYELVINLKTARARDLTLPPAVLARADEIIR